MNTRTLTTILSVLSFTTTVFLSTLLAGALVLATAAGPVAPGPGLYEVH